MPYSTAGWNEESRGANTCWRASTLFMSHVKSAPSVMTCKSGHTRYAASRPYSRLRGHVSTRHPSQLTRYKSDGRKCPGVASCSSEDVDSSNNLSPCLWRRFSFSRVALDCICLVANAPPVPLTQPSTHEALRLSKHRMAEIQYWVILLRFKQIELYLYCWQWTNPNKIIQSSLHEFELFCSSAAALGSENRRWS